MVASIAPPPAKINGDIKNLEGWILQMDNYSTITQTYKKLQRLASVDRYMEGEALECWKANTHRYNTWEEVKDTIRE